MIRRTVAVDGSASDTEQGQAGAEVILGGIVLLVGLILVLSNIWLVLDAKMAVTSAARSGGQTFIEQRTLAEASQALQSTMQTSLGSRFPRGWTATSSLASFERCAPVDVVVAVNIPLVAVPFLGSIGGTKTVRSTHHTRIDPYRSRVPGEANCA